MKNLKRIILMISMFAITGASVNCSFRSRLERRSARLRRTVDGQEGTRLSVQLSDSDRGNRLRRDREVSIPTRVTESSRLWLRNEFPELTQDDSIQQIRLILNDDHEKQNEFSEDFIEFIKGHFRILNSGDLYFDPIHIANTLTPSTNFDKLRQIYLDSILFNIEFIRNLFEDVFFLRLNIKSLDGMGYFYTLTLPLANFLRSNLFENAFEAVSIIDGCLNIHTPEEDLCVYNDDSDGVVNGLMFDFNIEKELDGLEDISDFLQIDYNFIIECFIRDIENQDLRTIERFVRFVEQNVEKINLKSTEVFVEFVVQNVEEDRATEIFYRCLRILNPENYDAIVERLSNIYDTRIYLNSLSLTTIQLAFLLPRLGQFINLQIFNLDDNQLTELPVDIVQFTNLGILRLADNRLTELPVEIGQLRNLRLLNLSFSRLTELPESIGRLTKLINLNLSFNRLTELPAEIGQLRNLNHLNLRDTSIEGFKEFYGDREEVQGFMNLYFNR